MGQSLAEVISENLTRILSVVLFVGLMFMLRLFLAVYYHTTWSGLPELTPGIFNPN